METPESWRHLSLCPCRAAILVVNYSYATSEKINKTLKICINTLRALKHLYNNPSYSSDLYVVKYSSRASCCLV